MNSLTHAASGVRYAFYATVLAATASTGCRAGVPAEFAHVRDPFAAPASRTQHGVATPGARWSDLPAMVLPANAGAGPLPFMVSPARGAVKAVVLGERSRALVAEGASTTVVAVGDRLFGAFVTRISSDGVRLSDGTLLAAPDARP